VAASIQEFAIKFGRNLDELYQNWLCTFDALLMHFSKVHQNVLKVHRKCIKSASSFKVHQKCIKSAPKVHQKCIKSAPKVHQKCTKSIRSALHF
jgi:hypothetical protein